MYIANINTLPSMRTLTILLLLIMLPICSLSQNITLLGTISDKQTGEALEDVHIIANKYKIGLKTDKSGKFSTFLNAHKEYVFTISHVGYKTSTIYLNTHRDTIINISLEQDNALEKIIVYGSKNNFGVRHSQMSAIELPSSKISYVPSILGETDVLKVLQTLPGVQSAGNGHAGIFVRGGGYDQNQITLDGSTLFNAEHLQGMISAINADMVESLVFYKGAFPARYGGQLSSVVDIGIKEGDMENYHGEISMGLLTSKFKYEGPIKKGQTSFNIAARASYIDLIVQPVLKEIANNNSAITPYTNINFYDINAKLTHRISNNHKISAFLYSGKDKNKESPTSSSSYTEKSSGEGVLNIVSKNTDIYSINNWGNTTASLSWLWLPSNDLSYNTSVSYSKYGYYLKLHRHYIERNESSYIKTGNIKEQSITDLTNFTEHNSGIDNYSVSFDANYRLSPTHDLRGGIKTSIQTLAPSIRLFQTKNYYYKTPYSDSQDTTKVDTYIGNLKEKLSIHSLYIEDEISLSERLKANIGLRYALFGIDNKIYHSLEPRLSMRLMVGDNKSFKLSYARMSQAIHMLSNTDLVSPSDIWVPITNKIPPMKSDQLAIGYNHEPLAGLLISIEGYYKNMSNLLEYKDGASFLTSGKNWEDLVTLGNGKSYGVELYIQKDIGETTGWLSYTWSRSLRLFNNSGEELNGGRTFYAGTDRRHNFNIVATRKISNNFDISIAWTFQTGRRGNINTTAYISGIEGEDSAYSGDGLWNNDYANLQLDKLGGFAPVESYRYRNGIKLPSVHRLDLSFNYYISHFIKNKKVESKINFSIYNVYNRLNVNSLYWGFISYEKNAKEDATLKGVCLLPIMPSLSYTIKF